MPKSLDGLQPSGFNERSLSWTHELEVSKCFELNRTPLRRGMLDAFFSRQILEKNTFVGPFCRSTQVNSTCNSCPSSWTDKFSQNYARRTVFFFTLTRMVTQWILKHPKTCLLWDTVSQGCGRSRHACADQHRQSHALLEFAASQASS